MGHLDGQHVLVTGGSSRIGKACAQRHREEGDIIRRHEQPEFDLG
jgi:NAD(P)-dependent dehydrogenase (short-subunit alcohol dehydrogenase family)